MNYLSNKVLAGNLFAEWLKIISNRHCADTPINASIYLLHVVRVLLGSLSALIVASRFLTAHNS